MNTLPDRIATDLEERLGRAQADLGDPQSSVVDALRDLTVALGRTTEYAVDVATTPLPDRPPKQLLVRESLLQHAVTALRAVETMDRFELAVHWKDQARDEAEAGAA